MIETYKITHDYYDSLTTDSLFTLSDTNTRSHRFKLTKPRVNTNLFLNFFTNSVINKWNGLPCKVVEAKSLNSFKNYIDKHFDDDDDDVINILVILFMLSILMLIKFRGGL